MLETDELAAWLRLLHSPGMGRDGARRLLASFGSPQSVFEASAAARRAVVGDRAASLLDAGAPQLADSLARVSAWQGACGGQVIVLGDPAYPALLLETADPPLLLYTQGRLELLQRRALAVVGSRNPSAQGLDNARSFARHLSERGLTVVSGLALGIDGAAHEGALAGEGSTIAVVGTGLDRVYPGRHRELAHRIATNGLLISEFPPGTPPLRENFPQRNRLIAGLALGTLVVEAGLPSGSLITARLAAEAGREVFAIPGSIHSPQSRGCHALIKQGAKLVESADDIWSELHPGSGPSTAPAADEAPADPLLDALGHDPVTLDALVARTGWPADRLAARLLEFELDGLVARLPGGLYQRRAAA